MKRLLISLLVFLAVIPAFAQLNYRIGTIIGDDAWQGYHVGAVDVIELFPRVDLEQVTMTPWEFGELWLGVGVEWHIPKPRNSGAQFSLGAAFVNRVDRTVQLLKNWRFAISGGISFEENPETGEIYLHFDELQEGASIF